MSIISHNMNVSEKMVETISPDYIYYLFGGVFLLKKTGLHQPPAQLH